MQRVDTFAILVAAGPSLLSRLTPASEKVYVEDPLTARLLTHLGAQHRFNRITPDEVVSCDSHTAITGTRFQVRLIGIVGDSASVGWSATCMLKSRYHPDGFLGGAASSYNLLTASRYPRR